VRGDHLCRHTLAGRRLRSAIEHRGHTNFAG
jgi:hypothetical protein